LQNAIKAGSGLQGLGDASDADVATAVNSITTASGAPQHKPDFFQIIGPILKKLLNDLTGINLDAIFPPSSPAGGPQLPAGYNPPGGVLPPAGTPLFNANGSPVLNPDGSQAVSPGPDNGGGFNPSAAANAVEQAVSDAAQLTRKDGKNAPFNKTVHQLQKKGKLPPGQLPIPGKKKKLPAKPAKGGGGGSGLIIPLAAGVALFALSGGSKSKH